MLQIYNFSLKLQRVSLKNNVHKACGDSFIVRFEMICSLINEFNQRKYENILHHFTKLHNCLIFS